MTDHIYNKKVIGFVGLPGSGKSTAINAVRHLGLVVTMGDVVRDEAKKIGINLDSTNLGQVAKDLRKKHGPTIIAERCVQKIKKLDSNIIIIDGLRSMDEVGIFRNNWALPIIFIDCPEKLRYKRLSERGRVDDTVDLGKIKARDNRELNFGLDGVIKNADFVIINDSDVNALQNETKRIVKSLIKSDDNQ